MSLYHWLGSDAARVMAEYLAAVQAEAERLRQREEVIDE